MHYGYLLRGQLTGLWKIGITGNLKRRISNYKTHTPERIQIEGELSFVSEPEAAIWEGFMLESAAELGGIHHAEWVHVSFSDMSGLWNTGNAATIIHAKQWSGIMKTCKYPEGERIARIFGCEDEFVAYRYLDFMNSDGWFATQHCATFESVPSFVTRKYLKDILAKDRETEKRYEFEWEEYLRKQEDLINAGCAVREVGREVLKAAGR